MAQLAVLVAGLLFVSHASDAADRSTLPALQGFLSKYLPSGPDAPKSSMNEYDKFITLNINRVKSGPLSNSYLADLENVGASTSGTKALPNDNYLAGLANNGASHAQSGTKAIPNDSYLAGLNNNGVRHSNDKPDVQSTAQVQAANTVQASYVVTADRAETSIDTKDVDVQKISVNEEKKAVLSAAADVDSSSKQAYGTYAIGVGLLLSLVLVGVGLKNFFCYGAGAYIAGWLGLTLKRRLDRPSRPYDREANSVGREYDAWTREGILEHYWGEHIHLGYYTEQEMKRWPFGYLQTNFVQAKENFTQKMMEWGGIDGMKNVKVLDVGCGIGGTTRYMAKLLPDSQITGITLSPEQAKRATELAEERGVKNVEFRVCDALAMDYADNTFDVVWGCESGEHMPDKEKYVTEMARVLKPGGKMVIATWCQRDNDTQPFTAEEEKSLDFLYSEWTHPFFISIKDYKNLLEGPAAMGNVETDDWWKQTIASWRHSIWVGVFDPWPVIRAGPRMWWKCLRDGICLERMHRAFDRKLMAYGMIKGTKPLPA